MLRIDYDLQIDWIMIFLRARTPETKPSTPAKPSNIEDMFRVDRQSTPAGSRHGTPAGSRHGTPARPPPEEDIFR